MYCHPNEDDQLSRQYQQKSEIIMRTSTTPKAMRRILAADGYLQLHMPDQAARELRKVDDAGMLEGPRQLLLGVALKRAGQSEAAIGHLETAARVMPSPVRSFAWSELSSCYRSMGNLDLAEMAETLGGEKTYELRIALPCGEISLESTESAAEAV